MLNFSVENSFFCGKLFPQFFPHLFHNCSLSPFLLTFLTIYFSTLHCGYKFYICGKLFKFFIYIIFYQFIFNLILTKTDLSTNVENFF